MCIRDRSSSSCGLNLKINKVGTAINTDEYVPIITPIIIVKAKGLITSPPKKNKDTYARSVVKLVITVLDKVLLTDKLKRSTNSSFLYFLKFSRTLSNITTVSLME